MYKSATKCNETIGKWCKNKHGASKIIDTLETYQPLVSMMVRKGRLGTSSLGVNIRGTICLRELGGHALCGEGGDWLGSMTGPHTMEVWMGMYARLCSTALISFGRTHLCRV
jgi:hypothetical protein